MLTTVLFDLDGTLLPMDLDEFIKLYFHALSKKMASLGYDAKCLLNGVIIGTKAMVANDGQSSNEEVFWKAFESSTQILRKDCEDDFLQFYLHEFNDLGSGMAQSENMKEAVRILQEKGYRMLLTTNPMFPEVAVKERVEWAGIDANVFQAMTSYEYCHYTKPNIGYYKEVIEKEHLNPEECMMVGNDSFEDGAIESLGIPLYLVCDHLIHRDANAPLQSKWHGSSEEFLAFVKDLPYVSKGCDK